MGKKIIPNTFAPLPTLRLENVAKKFCDTIAVESLSLQIAPGECCALVGPSGCGKTTTLRLIAGLESPDWGEIHLNGKCVSSTSSLTPPNERKVALVFQDLALWPHMTVAQHISFTLDSKRYKGKAKKTKIEEIVSLVHLEKTLLNRYPHQLSGGEQQRLAIGRALAQEPNILLMDEPFSSLDPDLKNHLMKEIHDLIQKLNITLIYVTHQWQEAVFMAEKVATMQKGKITSIMGNDSYKDKMQKNETVVRIKQHAINL